MKIPVILAFAFVVLVPGTAFGAEGYFEGDYGRQVSHNPIVCIFQPDDSRVSDAKWKIWYSDARRGIDNWRSVLEQSGSGEWDITVREVPLSKLDLLNRDVCDITVEFVDRPYMQEGRYANALGWWLIDTKITKIVYSSFEYCGVEYDQQFGIFVNSICFNEKFERSKFMASVVQHEFGHALGLGHYIAYDRVSMQDWYDTGIGYPSIMTPMPPNEEMKTITQEDIQRVRQIYGPNGFGERKSYTPLFNERIIEEPRVEISEKTILEISGDETAAKTIQGSVPDKLYKRGVYVDLIVQGPDGEVDHKTASVSKTLKKYKAQLVFGDSDPGGAYTVTHKFNDKEFYKEEIIVLKSAPTKPAGADKPSSIDKPAGADKPSSIDKPAGADKPSSIDKPAGADISKSIDKDTDSDGIKDSDDYCKTKPETYNGYRDTDGCPDKEQVYKAKTPIFTAHQKDMMTQRIDAASESFFKLKDGMNVTWKYLEDANSKYTDSQAKKHVEKAWNIYNKLDNQRMDSAKSLEEITLSYLRLKDQAKTSNWSHYQEFTGKLDQINSSISKIGSDMRYISQELDYAEKAQTSAKAYNPEKPCVLWWC